MSHDDWSSLRTSKQGGLNRSKALADRRLSRPLIAVKPTGSAHDLRKSVKGITERCFTGGLWLNNRGICDLCWSEFVGDLGAQPKELSAANRFSFLAGRGGRLSGFGETVSVSLLFPSFRSFRAGPNKVGRINRAASWHKILARSQRQPNRSTKRPRQNRSSLIALPSLRL